MSAARRVFTVGELNRSIQAALQEAFPAAVWVRGEVQRLSRNRSGHIYFELHGEERGATLQIKVAALKWDRERFDLDRYFDGGDPDFQFREKIEVCLQGAVDFYPGFGTLSLKLVGVDKAFALGQLEAKRREVMAWLEREGLLRRNAALPFPDLPLRVGLITSAGSAAERDFLSGLGASPFGFRVLRADCRMMGEAMVGQVVGALEGLAAVGVDVVVITRGGGSRADLAWFDRQELAAAIARSPLPVVTAIGHEIDRSIADEVAHHACKTPTAAAEDLVGRIDAAARRVEEAVARLGRAAPRAVESERRQLRQAAGRLRPAVTAGLQGGRLSLLRGRERLLAAGRLLLREAQTGQRARERRLAESAHRAARGAALSLDALAGALVRRAPAAAVRSAAGLDHLDEKLRLLDPRRLLARGWTLTVDPAGRVVRAAAGLRPGDRLTTRFADGAAASVVESVDSGHNEANGG